MLQTVWATVRDGKIEPLEPVELPEGSRMIITIIPDEESGDWLRISELALDTVWANPEDDMYSIEPLRDVMRQISDAAQDRGLTPQILDHLLDNDN